MDLQYYIQVIFSLFVILLLLFGALRLSKVWNQKKYTGDIKILDRVPLNTNVLLLIVEIRGKQMLLSVGGQEISILKEFK